ncbi:InlB B-repeat-containing protein, partial [Faecalibaculum rodentium]|uniref:InlB B-repeat-containing protein n=1 Tax=Faecalibaculum rodentium TaxID=1702221 RepID=UPI0023F0F324
MNRILEAATAAACMLSVMGPSAVFAEEKPAGDTKEHTLEVTYIYPDGTEKAAGDLTYKSVEKKNAEEGRTYLSLEDLQTFVMKHQPDKGYEASLSQAWFDQDKKNGTTLSLEDLDLTLDTDTLYLQADQDDGEYDIVFYQAPGKVFSQETVKAGDKIPLPEKDPGKTGYVFDGWNLKEGTRAEQNLYLYPKWTQETAQAQGDGVRNVTLTFDPENGQPAQVLTV